MPDHDFHLTTLRVEATAETRVDVDDDLLGRGVRFPSGTIIMEWNRDAYPEADRLEFPHRSTYGSIEDVQQGTGGEVILEGVTDVDADVPDSETDSGETTDETAPTGDETTTDDEADASDGQTDDAPQAPDSGETDVPDEPPEDGYVLEIGSTASTPAMEYRFTVPGEVEEYASLETHDTIESGDDVTVVTGTVGPKGTDVYRIAERPTSWQVLDRQRRFVARRRYDLRLDGQDVALEDLLQDGRQTRRVEIVAPGELDYTLEATGTITKLLESDAGEWAAEPNNDEVRETDAGTWLADGYTGNGYGDAYLVKGDLVDFQPVHGAFAVYVDGVQIRPASIVEGELEEVDPAEVGGGEGYADTVPPSEADVEVSDLASLQDALASASSGDVVYVAGNATIPMGATEITVPKGVTLASNRGIAGAPGGHLRTDRETTQIHVKAGARVTGLQIQGKYYDYFDPRGDPNRYPSGDGIEVEGGDVEIDNCEVWGYAYAAIDNNSYSTHIHHNHIHHTPRDGLGYGVVVNGGHPVIEWNYFNFNRHAVAGSGGGGYTVQYNHVGPDTIGHVFDMHKPGGDRLVVRRNTVEATQKIPDGGGAPAVAIRGSPSDEALIEGNWFHNPDPPRSTPNGWTQEAIIQVGVNQWTNVTEQRNHYGADQPDAEDVGAPAHWSR